MSSWHCSLLLFVSSHHFFDLCNCLSWVESLSKYDKHSEKRNFHRVSQGEAHYWTSQQYKLLFSEVWYSLSTIRLSHITCNVRIIWNHLRARLGAVHDRVASIEREGILKFSQTFLSKFITGVDHPPICLHNVTAVNCYFCHSINSGFLYWTVPHIHHRHFFTLLDNTLGFLTVWQKLNTSIHQCLQGNSTMQTYKNKEWNWVAGHLRIEMCTLLRPEDN